MPTRPPPPPLYEPAILNDLRTLRGRESVGTGKADQTVLAVATRLQRLRLVRVVPVTRSQARIEFTEQGLAALRGL